MAVISVKNLSKHYTVHRKESGIRGTVKSLISRSYENVKAVDNISFTIEPGEVIGFIGPNGAGKTTTLKTLSGLLYPTTGEVSVLGYTPFHRNHEFLKQIALVMGQKNQLLWDLPAIDTFLLNKEIYKINDSSFKKVITDLTKRLDVKEYIEVPVRKLSLGQRMKMEIIASLIHSPRVLFLDEPTIGLDIVMQKVIREFLHEYNKEYNATILLTSHYMADVEALCKRVIIINHGQIIYDGLLTDLVKKYAPYKSISVVLQDHVEQKKLQKYGTTKLFNFPVWTLHVDNKNANKVASQILQDLSVDDVVIEDPDIEDVIEEVFNKAHYT